MKKFFKWLGILLACLVVIFVIYLLIMAQKGNTRITRIYNVTADNVLIPTDTESIARGAHWIKVICAGCHKDDLAGGTLLSAPFAMINAKNLTSGKGGAGAEFKDADWIRAIRHGVNPENHSLLVMPSFTFWYFSDQDLGDIIAYVKSVPPVDKETPDPNLNLLGKAMLGAGLFGNTLVSAEEIKQNERPAYPAVGVTVDYGTYLVNVSGCHDCHGPKLAGGKSADPSAKNAPNLTPGGDLSKWQEADFINTIRTGVNPKNEKLDPKQMPWKDFMNFTDDELKAIFMYLKTLPKLETVVP